MDGNGSTPRRGLCDGENDLLLHVRDRAEEGPRAEPSSLWFQSEVSLDSLGRRTR